MTDSTRENGEPTSFGQKAKNWYEKKKPPIHAVGIAVGAMGALAAVAYAVAQADEDKNRHDEETGSASDPAEEKEQRNSPGKHNVAPHKRQLKDGREIDVSGYERGGSSDDEVEDPGDAAA
ncbi:hypothetical protein ACFRH6_28050 [Streptomyces sp. NPDC056749]|uniref:hypothetical protein n=1 Tax=Streptomyces sp. NPDC056749 TaxID=3345936 RepID=UPI0036CAEAFA